MEASSLLAYQLLNDIGADGMVVVLLLIFLFPIGVIVLIVLLCTDGG